MTKARILRSLSIAVLPLAGLVAFYLPGKDAPSAPPAPPEPSSRRAPISAGAATQVASHTAAKAPPAPPLAGAVEAPATQAEEALELPDHFRTRVERERYYDARSRYEAEMAAALRRVAAELSDVAEADDDQPSPESERAEHDVNVESLSERIHTLEAEAERHAQRGARYAAAR